MNDSVMEISIGGYRISNGIQLLGHVGEVDENCWTFNPDEKIELTYEETAFISVILKQLNNGFIPKEAL